MENDTPRRMPNVPPFVKFVCANVPMVFDDSLSYYEALCALWKYVQGMTDVINNNATLEEEYIEKFNELSGKFDELKNYVDTYFDNLDVQEEINNKLDQMAEDGTLEGLLRNIIPSEVKYIFPKFVSNVIVGDVSVTTIKDKAIMVDTGIVGAYTPVVKPMLQDNDIEHIDCLIISHYDPDHIGGLSGLVGDGYIDENTNVYLSARVTTYGEDYTTAINNVLNLLVANSIPYSFPEDNEVISIYDLSIKFYNCDADTLDAITPKDGNNCSMQALFTHGNTSALFTGDATRLLEERLFANNFPATTVDLYKIPHHGLNGYCSYEFVKGVSPKYAISITGETGYRNGDQMYGQEESIMDTLGTICYQSYNQPEYPKFVSNGFALQCVSGVSRNVTNRFINQTLYVDAAADITSVQDGTEDHPFSCIKQAIGAVPKVGDVRATINIADGNYNETVDIYSTKNVRITLAGNSGDKSAVTIKNIVAYGVSLFLKNLTVYNTAKSGVEVNYAYLNIENVDIKSSDGTTSNNTSLIINNQSVVDAKSLTLTQSKYLMSIYNASVFNATGTVTLGTYSHTNSIITDNGARLYTNGWFAFTDSAEKVKFTRWDNRTYTPVQIMSSHTNYSPNVSVVRTFADFKYVEIYYHSSDNEYGYIKIYEPNGKNARLRCDHVGGSDANPVMYNKSCKIALSGTSLNISMSVQEQININNDTVSWTMQDTPSYFNIDRIIGHYFDDSTDVA